MAKMELRNNNEALREMLDGKSVVLVGCAPYMLNKSLGFFIDSFDIVIRMNRAMPIVQENADDIGSKTDILYAHYVICRKPNMIPKEVPMVVTTNPTKGGTWPIAHSKMSKYIEAVGSEYHNLRDEYITTIKEKVGSHPTTGMLAIYHLLGFPIKSLQLLGMTFQHPTNEKQEISIEGYNRGYWREKTYRDIIRQEDSKQVNHSHKLELAHLNEILNDGRVQIDLTLQKILKENT